MNDDMDKRYLTKEEFFAYLKEESKRWEEQNRKWWEEMGKLKEHDKKWEEQNKKWQEQEKKWEEQNKKWWEEMEKLREHDKKWEEQNKKWQEQEKKWEEQNKKWWEEMGKLREHDKKWEEQNKKWQEQEKKWEEQNKKWWEEMRKLDLLERRIQKGLSKIGARLGVKLEGFSRALIREFLSRNKMGKSRPRRLVIFDEEGKVFGQPDRIEIDIFIQKPLVVGEITSFLNEKDKLYNFDRKVKLLQERFKKEAKLKFIACLDVDPDVKKEVYRLAKRLGIKILVED